MSVPSRPTAVVVTAVCAVLLGLASPAVAAPSPLAATVAPVCRVAGIETITGVMFVNNQFVNGTWNYATGVACTAKLADIVLYEELDHNGARFDYKGVGFTGVPLAVDGIVKSVPCAVCNGTWVFKFAQILKAASGFAFTAPAAGCVLAQAGLYEVCIETKSVTL